MSGTGFDRVRVVRDGTTVLRDLTLSAADGELVVVLGPSGSGKSSLLRALAGLDPVASGQVTIRGRDVTRLPADQRRVAMVFEAAALVPFLDVSRNLGWGLRMQGLPEPEVEERVTDRARRLRLSRLLSRRPAELSSGERGLVGIGRALVQVPDVFLLDEPLSNLDAASRMQSRRQIVDVVRELGVTTFYVTHDQSEALAVADRIALLHGGRIVQLDPPMELYERPADLVVAGFVGSPPIGLLSARLVTADGLAGFQVGPRILPLWRPAPPPLETHVGREVVLGFRPEDVHRAAAGHDPETVSLRGVVTGVEYTGRNTLVSVAIDGPAVTAAGADAGAVTAGSEGSNLRALYPADARIVPGDGAQVAVEAARAHVFDAVTGRALWHPADADDAD